MSLFNNLSFVLERGPFSGRRPSPREEFGNTNKALQMGEEGGRRRERSQASSPMCSPQFGLSM